MCSFSESINRKKESSSQDDWATKRRHLIEVSLLCFFSTIYCYCTFIYHSLVILTTYSTHNTVQTIKPNTEIIILRSGKKRKI